MADRHSEHVGSDRIPLQPRRDGGACLSCTTQGETPGECMIGIISLDRLRGVCLVPRVWVL